MPPVTQLASSEHELKAPDVYWSLAFHSSVLFPRDRLRTTTNVLGDSLGAGIVEHLSRHELKNRDVEMGNSVIEENEMKKPYQLISQESEIEKSMDSETKMQTNTKKYFLELQVFENHYSMFPSHYNSFSPVSPFPPFSSLP